MPHIFAQQYPPKAPSSHIMCNAHADETIQVDVKVLGNAPCAFANVSSNPKDYNITTTEKKIFLWVMTSENIVYLEEYTEAAQNFNAGKVKHTNLTGGAPACSGGEMWFCSPKALYVSGCSGRYGPSTEEELFEGAAVFKRKCYKTCCLGWDADRDAPAQMYREGVARWI